jgi:type II secretory ATPase GspE/PulE/Tfp pilus assembly ATPase PilB-like protein
LYAVLSKLNKEGVNIVTLEDPVEYFLKGVNQSQINPDVGLTFASGLRSILRQDPDIILVGEIRDGETADLAIHAALTGHLMLSTLHTNDAFGAVPRLVDLKAEPFLLASTLNVIIAQRLVRKLCQDCKTKVDLPDNLKEEVVAELKKVPSAALPKGVDLSKKLTFWKGQGCKRCGGTGYRGRSSIAEVLPVNDDVKDIINQQAQWHRMKEVFVKLGMLTIKQDGIIKALKGVTTIEEIIRATKE